MEDTGGTIGAEGVSGEATDPEGDPWLVRENPAGEVKEGSEVEPLTRDSGVGDESSSSSSSPSENRCPLWELGPELVEPPLKSEVLLLLLLWPMLDLLLPTWPIMSMPW